MTAYYLEGNNIAWLNGVCLFLIVIGFLCTLTKFIIPKKISLRMNIDYILAFGVMIALAAIVTAVIFTSRSFTMDELEAGRHWKKDCKLLEVNIPTGTFSEPVNKQGCGGVIINVPKLQYDEYIRQWELYEGKER
ncbi:hypothetical protein VXE67_26685 [Klebsiella oxytoca]|uniref:hypothetical protein n=1 Tax=Klebsiella oxytoca TaxID=571 RepID=UPI002E182701|nr:hypothetical protein [Klebsiella oxytoca]